MPTHRKGSGHGNRGRCRGRTHWLSDEEDVDEEDALMVPAPPTLRKGGQLRGAASQRASQAAKTAAAERAAAKTAAAERAAAKTAEAAAQCAAAIDTARRSEEAQRRAAEQARDRDIYSERMVWPPIGISSRSNDED